MKYLIVNADDFGASRGINRGIVEAYRDGILTSTSLMVNMPASEEAALLSREVPDLSIGLHVNFTGEGEPVVNEKKLADYPAELQHQLDRFQALLGRLPTHLDSHHNIHRDPRLLPHFLEAARQHRLPMREHSPVRYFSRFYGQWDGETHLEQIRVEKLLDMLRTEVHDGFTELSCHPGYVQPDFPSVYAIEREAELRTLCNPLVRDGLAELGIRLIGFRDIKDLEIHISN